MGSIGSGPLCIQTYSSTPNILQLKTRWIQCFLRCLHHLRFTLRKSSWSYGPPQGILPNRKSFKTNFRTFHGILERQVHKVLQLTLSQVGELHGILHGTEIPFLADIAIFWLSCIRRVMLLACT